MDAALLLARIAEMLERHRLEGVLVGNAAAALQGAPVTVVKIDFLFRRTPANLRKLKAIASELDAVVMRQFYPVGGLYRISRDADGLQIDFMSETRDVRLFRGLTQPRGGDRNRGDRPKVERKADGCPTRESSKKRRITRRTRLAALKKESDLALRDQIRRLLAMPPGQRTHFLRKRVGICMSCL